MPNWCDGYLVITGPPADIKKFKRFAKEPGKDGQLLDANKFIPYPKKFQKLDEKYQKQFSKEESLRNKENYYDMDDYQKRYFDFLNPRKSWEMRDGYNRGGYEWCVSNWGSKWNFCRVSLTEDITEEDTSSLEYSFESAWSPLVPVVAKMAEMFPTLCFEYKYAEPGIGFIGLLYCENGKVMIDDCHDMTPEEYAEWCGEEY